MDGDKRQWLTGFETQNVPDTCLCPVLLVPGQTAITAITKIVFACDLEDMQDTIEQSGLLNILNNLQARLIVLHVDKPGKASSTAAVQQLPVIQHLLRPYKPSYFYLENELPQMAIARFTREHDASIVMIVRKRKGLFSKLFHASLTRSLAVETAVPMLILHATKNYPVRKI